MEEQISLKKHIVSKIKQRKKDVFVFLVLLFVVLAIYVGFKYFGNENGKYVKVYVNNKLTKTFKLNSDVRYMIKSGDGYNFLMIKNNQARIVDADCENLICKDKGSISKKNESIICVPHKVVVTIDSDEEASVDAVAD